MKSMASYFLRKLGIFVLVAGFLSSAAFSQVNQDPSVTVDWLRLNMSYTAKSSPSPEESWIVKTAEAEQIARKTIQEGKFVFDQLGLDQNRDQISSDLLEGAKVNTIYRTDNIAEVSFEVQLSRLLKTSLAKRLSIEIKEEEKLKTLNSAIIVEIPKGARPRALPSLCTDDGKVVYSIESIDAQGFQKNFTGRWFFENQKGYLKSFLGENPITIRAISEQNQCFIISEDDWVRVNASNLGLLSQARIAFRRS